ncbi:MULTISPECIES: hypothetical protein [unclassified Vibrio]|uniref:hypothetical protein n=1 Tax=Vibrio TaxID=662 RepID=UPI0012690925|nr:MULTISPECIES: hypothetical protein [unclassified Vibrio]QFT40030.1 hypothetical protein FIU99_26940 [Vibrio sp. THAF64]QGM37975.1 hypothetical protein GGC04_27145 [Vibrio sp. THAF191d]QGN73445.1 hypothetical protein GGC03_27030 [Vibrio sp. THAF191c]
MIPNNSIQAQIENNVSLIKQELKRKQYPSKNAPVLNTELLITICGCTFKVLRQEKRSLVLVADEKVNFERGINILRSISYIAGARSSVSIMDYDWRPTRYKGNKLYLRPVAPTIMK